MLRRLLTSGLAALVLSFSCTVVAKVADEPASDALHLHEAADAQPEPAFAPAETAFSQASAAVVQAAAAVAHTFVGIVSYYGREFAGRKTANGERFDPGVLTMAHKTLAFGTLVRVTNLNNNRSVVVRVNDRGPFVASRVGDLSAGAANLLGMLGAGVVQARLEVLSAALTQALK
jgi:rare lipoprotein A